MAEGTSPYLLHGKKKKVVDMICQVMVQFSEGARRAYVAARFVFYRCFLGSMVMMMIMGCFPPARSRADKPFNPVSETARCLRSDGDKFFLLATWNEAASSARVDR